MSTGQKQDDQLLREALEQLGHDALDLVEHHNELHVRQGSAPCRSVEKTRILRNLKMLRSALREPSIIPKPSSHLPCVVCGETRQWAYWSGRVIVCDRCDLPVVGESGTDHQQRIRDAIKKVHGA